MSFKKLFSKSNTDCIGAAAAKSLQSCPTLCHPIDSSPPGSAIPGILQARTLEWVAISFSNAWKWKVKMKSLSRVWLLANPWTAPSQAPLSMGFSRQGYWSGVPLPSPSLCLVLIKKEKLIFYIFYIYNEWSCTQSMEWSLGLEQHRCPQGKVGVTHFQGLAVGSPTQSISVNM